jgi:hypothetical protein
MFCVACNIVSEEERVREGCSYMYYHPEDELDAIGGGSQTQWGGSWEAGWGSAFSVAAGSSAVRFETYGRIVVFYDKKPSKKPTVMKCRQML